jgi:tetratricopeptide (TPR) repeat protein
MPTLLLRHLAGSDPPRFVVQRAGGKETPPAEVPSPVGFPVEGRPKSDLVRELAWYLEAFLEYPFSPETEHADRVLAALRAWGEKAFDALFDNREGGTLFAAATAGGYEGLLLQAWSDDARVLAWPWEALRDPKAGALAPPCGIERRLNEVPDPAPVPAGLPSDRVNILLCIARPLEGDVKYRSIARPLVELIEKQDLPAYVHVLRPPTFERLREHLRERPGYYHLVHFDGHGSYGGTAAPSGPHAFGAPEGELIFEDAQGKKDPVSAEKLSVLLREHKVPAVVLNACRSAMLDEGAEDPFASVAAALLRAGTRSVVAMSYALYVSGAQQFLPAFYRRLFERGSFVEAARAGRQQMFAERGRVCARGKYELHDWLVPVVYQQEEGALSFAAKGEPPVARRKLPKEALDGENPYGFIGRDGAILEIERALRRAVPAILVHGLAGVGKTTLARGMVEWLAATEGLGEDCYWFSFQEIRSAEYVFNRIGEALLGPEFGAGSIEDKIDKLIAMLTKRRHIIVWDNFEVVVGVTEFRATLSAADRTYLKTFLQRLRGGLTKVIITSRSEEEWLGPELRRKVELGGMDGEETWAFAERILGDLGIAIDREDKDLVELMKLLGGHPLMMRVALPRLEKQRTGELINALRSNLATLGGSGDDGLKKLYATLKLAEDVLPEDLKPLLVPLGMHERYVEGRWLEAMGRQVDDAWTQNRIDKFLGTLANAGLLRDRGQSIYEMHPALTGFLRVMAEHGTVEEVCDRWSHGFVVVMATLADILAPRELYEQRIPFHLHAANFYQALDEAERLGIGMAQAALTQGLATYAQHTRSFSEATNLFLRLAETGKKAGNLKMMMGAYHQLGLVVQVQRDFVAARAWYLQSLAISEKHGYELDAAKTYHQLGTIAQNEHDSAAADWYLKSLDISERHHDEHLTALTYQQLGRIAEDQSDIATAGTLSCKALAIFEKRGDEHHASMAYHQLARLAQKQRDFNTAAVWCHKTLRIAEKHGDELGVAMTYGQLGIIAAEQRDFPTASACTHKALAIFEKQADEYHVAVTSAQLGVIARFEEHFEESGRWLIKGIRGFVQCNDPASVDKEIINFAILYKMAPAEERAGLQALWEAAGVAELPHIDEVITPDGF